jgi:DNA repair protein RadA/Sms
MFQCSNCKKTYSKWQGQCSSCQEWGTITEVEQATAKFSTKSRKGNSKVKSIKNVEVITLNKLTETKNNRNNIVSGIEEFDNAIGGRIVAGQVILLAGTPGIGKSTLCSQLTEAFSKQNKKILYICGEESPYQIKQRTDRMGLKQENVEYISEMDISVIETYVSQNSEKYEMIFVDSIQTVFEPNLPSASGSVSQISETTNRLVSLSKGFGIPTIIIGHVTKTGDIAGPKILEHMVDTVLYFEGEKRMELRILRVEKNRFGPTDEVGIFKMSTKGLEQVRDTKELFDSTIPEASGSVFSMILEGNRPVVIEVQALCVKTYFPQPRRTASGFDFNRLNILIAVIEKILKIPMGEYDVYVNITGGMKVNDSGLDLAIIAAIVSSVKNKAIPRNLIYFGEVGLTGELRKIWLEDKRKKESKRLGFSTIIGKDLVNVKNLR